MAKHLVDPLMSVDGTVAKSSTSSKSWGQRTFGRLESGSMRGSIFTMAATAMGAGYLAIPRIMEYTGVVLGTILITACGIINYFSLLAVSQSCFRCHTGHYSSAVRDLLGHSWAVLLDIAIIFNAIGLIIALNIVISQLGPSILEEFGVGFEGDKYVILLALNALVVVPFGLQRKLGALRFKAMFNITSVIYVLVLVLVQSPAFWSENDFSQVEYAKLDRNFFAAFALGMFAYLCHQNLARMQAELINSNARRMRKVAFRSVALMDVLFTLLSLFGYLSLMGRVPSIIVMREKPLTYERDWAMVVARICICLTVTAAIPINISPYRSSVEKRLFNVRGHSSTFMHAGITIGTIVVCLLIAIFFPNIKFMFSFLGGFCAVIMALLIPGALFIKLNGKPLTSFKNLLIAFVVGGLSLVAFMSVVIETIDQFL